MKLYLGYNEQALKNIDKCLPWFEKMRMEESNNILNYNYSKGYFNSLHLAAVVYSRLGIFNKADSLIRDGIHQTATQTRFSIEKSYFLKSKGIRAFQQMKYRDALEDLQDAVPELKKADDFAWLAVVYFYIAQTMDKTGNKEKAISYYTKVDSIYTKRQFVLPELRENFIALIAYYRSKNDTKEELYYTRQLTKVDTDLFSSFRHITPKVLKNWETKTGLSKQPVFTNRMIKYGLIIISSAAALCFTVIIFRMRSKKNNLRNISDRLFYTTASSVATDLHEKISQKLEEFEQSKGFLDKGIRLPKLASKFGTNEKYLSNIVHTNKGMSFHRYISDLRIRYIIDALDNGEFLNYTVQGLADECGIASRQNFSKLFKEYTNRRPTDYIAEKKKQLEKYQP